MCVDIAHYIECFVGKGKWILRSSDDGRALLEFGFTGVFATYSFHDDRSTVALFDVQVRLQIQSKNNSLIIYSTEVLGA